MRRARPSTTLIRVRFPLDAVARLDQLAGSLRARSRRRIRRAALIRTLVQLRLSSADEVRRAKMHWRHLQKVEKGEGNATLRTITRISGALNVDPSNLLMALVPTNATVNRRLR